MKKFLIKQFFIRFFQTIHLISNKSIQQLSVIKEFFAFLLIKILLIVRNHTPTSIPAEQKPILPFWKRIYRFWYKILLLIMINFCTFYLKFEKVFLFIFSSFLIIALIFYHLYYYSYLIEPNVLHYNTAATNYEFFSVFFKDINFLITDEVLQFFLAYIVPIGTFCCFYLYYWLTFAPFNSTVNIEDSFCETILIFLLQAYTLNFLENTTEEIIETLPDLEDSYQIHWDDKTMWLVAGSFILLTQQVWTIDFYQNWAIFAKRQNINDADTYLVHRLLNYPGLRNCDNNSRLFTHYFTFHSDDEEEIGDSIYFFTMPDFYQDHLRIILFKLHPYLTELQSTFFTFFFILVFLLVFLNIIIEYYINNITVFYMTKYSYNIYRPFLDQYFYIWYKLSTAIQQTTNSTLFLRNPFFSQYLDLFKLLPDQESTEEGISESLFTDIISYPNLEEQFFNWDDDEFDQLDNIPTTGPARFYETRFIVLFGVLYFIVEIFRPHPLFYFSECLNEATFKPIIPVFQTNNTTYTDFVTLINNYQNNLKKFLTYIPFFIPLSHTKEESLLFQSMQLSPLMTYLGWQGWTLLPFFKKSFFFVSFPQSFTTQITAKTKHYIKQQYKTTYWDYFYEKFLPIFTKTTLSQKLQGSINRKKRKIKSSIIWFGKRTIEFFLNTTLLPKFRFKRKKKRTNKYIIKKIYIALNQKKYFLQKKESYLKHFSGKWDKKD